MRKLILTLLLAALAITLTACANTVDLSTTQESGDITAIGELTYDWQDINIEGGTVSKVFKFMNSGDDPLVLKGAVTSCMCTEATFTLPNGKKSPAFGMHQNPNWNYAVEPGEEFSIDVVFDPMAHGPNGVGAIQRIVYISSSSIKNEITEIDENTGAANTKLETQGNVLSKEDYEKKNNKLGFKFNQQEYDFGIIKQSGGITSYNFEFEYVGDKPIVVTSTPASCACTKATISSKNLKPGDKGTLTVEFDPNLHEEPEGRFFKTISIQTNPKLESQPELKIWAEIDLDLGPDAYKQKEEHEDDEAVTFTNIQPAQLKQELASKDFFLIDVHTPEQEHINNTDAVIPYTAIANNLDQLPKDKTTKIVVYCRSGSMSKEAAQTLIDLGYKNVVNLEGGRDAYIKQ